MTNHEKTFQALQLILERHKSRLLQYKNVTGVAVGYKKVKGVKTNIPSIVVFVKKKLPVSELAPSEIIPPTIEGIPTDVVEAEFKLLSSPPPRTSRIRPAIGGISVGHCEFDQTRIAGTLSDIMVDYINRRKVVVSNNHVLALCAPYGPARKGDPITQPGPYDGGTSDDTIANLERWVPFSTKRNVVDVAIATPISDEIVSNNHYDFGVVSGPPPKLHADMRVQKGGRTTGLTEGVIAYFGGDWVGTPYGSFWFDDLIFVESKTAFSQPGDSGSLTVEKDTKKPVGLLFAGNEPGTLSVVCKMGNVSNLIKTGYLPVAFGRIVDEKGKPVQNASVKLSGTDVTVFSDSEGKIMVGNLKPYGKNTLEILHPQYEVKTVEFTPDSDYVNLGDIPLKPLPPAAPSLSFLISDMVTFVGFAAIFTYWFAPEIISSIKEALSEI